jgi:hypothetical protein
LIDFRTFLFSISRELRGTHMVVLVLIALEIP